MSRPQFTLSAGAHNVVAVYTDGKVCTTLFIPHCYFPMPAEQLETIKQAMKKEYEDGLDEMLTYLLAQNGFAECTSNLSKNGLHCECVNETCPECGTTSCCFCGEAKAGTTPMTWAGKPNKPCEDCEADMKKLQRKVQ